MLTPMAAATPGPGRRGLGEIAHDLRSGLSATQAYLDLARERLADGEAVQDEDLERVERGITRLAATIAEIESMARAAKPPEGSR